MFGRLQLQFDLLDMEFDRHLTPMAWPLGRDDPLTGLKFGGAWPIQLDLAHTCAVRKEAKLQTL